MSKTFSKISIYVLCGVLAIYAVASFMLSTKIVDKFFQVSEFSGDIAMSFEEVPLPSLSPSGEKILKILNPNSKIAVIYLPGRSGLQSNVLNDIALEYNVFVVDYTSFLKSKRGNAVDVQNYLMSTVESAKNYVNSIGFSDESIILVSSDFSTYPAVQASLKYTNFMSTVLYSPSLGTRRFCANEFSALMCIFAGHHFDVRSIIGNVPDLSKFIILSDDEKLLNDFSLYGNNVALQQIMTPQSADIVSPSDMIQAIKSSATFKANSVEIISVDEDGSNISDTDAAVETSEDSASDGASD